MMSTKKNNIVKDGTNVDLQKREFMGKVGKYAVGAGMATLMTPTLSTAGNYDCNNGWGNGDQCAPGESLPVNQAENTIPAGTDANNYEMHGESNPQ